MQLARRARARPDTGLSGNGAAGQPADSWSRWCAAFGPSWVCHSPCVPQLPAPLSPTLQGGTQQLSLGLGPRTLQDPPLSNAAPSDPLISPGLLWRSVVPPSPREGTAATQPDRRPPTTRRSQLRTPAPERRPRRQQATGREPRGFAQDAFPAQLLVCGPSSSDPLNRRWRLPLLPVRPFPFNKLPT